MRLRWLQVLILILLLALSACNQPAHAFVDVQGHKISTANWKNKWVIINYWASWCEACAVEIPQLNLFYEHHQQSPVVLIGVNYDNLSGSDLVNAVSTLHISFPVLQTNPTKALGLPAINVLPTTFVINPEGKVVKELYGPQTAAGLEGIINEHH